MFTCSNSSLLLSQSASAAAAKMLLEPSSLLGTPGKSLRQLCCGLMKYSSKQNNKHCTFSSLSKSPSNQCIHHEQPKRKPSNRTKILTVSGAIGSPKTNIRSLSTINSNPSLSPMVATLPSSKKAMNSQSSQQAPSKGFVLKPHWRPSIPQATVATAAAAASWPIYTPSDNSQNQQTTSTAAYPRYVMYPSIIPQRTPPVVNNLDLPQRIPDPRHWQFTTDGFQHLQRPLPGLDFTVMSYNILSQKLLDEHLYLYRNCLPQALDWNYRGKAILNEIGMVRPDIACLQEVQDDHFLNFFCPKFTSMGYQASFKKRTRTKKDGCALLYKTDKFEAEKIVNVEYFRDDVDVLKRDNVGIVALLKPKNVKANERCNKLCVATTHLLFSPSRGDIKLAQLMILLAEVDKVAFKGYHPSTGKPQYHPIILCGDFNSEPYSPLYQYVRMGALPLDDLRCSAISGQEKNALKGKLLQKDIIINNDIGISSDSRYMQNNDNTSKIIPKDSSKKVSSSDGGSSLEEEPKPSFQQNLLTHNFSFMSSYQHMDSNGHPEVSTFHSRAACTVDYLFYSTEENSPHLINSPTKSPQRNELTHLASFSLLNPYQLQMQGSLPSLTHPSDHLPLIARFVWNPVSSKS